MKKLFLFIIIALLISCQDKIQVIGVKLDKSSAQLAIGATTTLRADLIPLSATNKGIIWSSSDNNIATVTDNSTVAAYATGLVTGKAVGTVTITATSKNGNYTATCVVRVVNLEFELVRVEGGTFTMGCTDGDCRSDGREEPAHQVTVSTFNIAKYPVTQRQWEAIMGYNPSTFRGDINLPVETVSWDDVQAFIQKLNALTGKNYRLPTEAEWEYAARGGNKSEGYKFSGSNDVNEVAWHVGNSNNRTHPVGLKKTNELGIYDMSGNVFELCSDWAGYYTDTPQIDPPGPDYPMIDGRFKVTRGGCFSNDWLICRVSARGFSWSLDEIYYDTSFRLLLP